VLQTQNYHRLGEICFTSATIPYRTTMSKIKPCFFFAPREELYTGEETPLDLLLNGISLSSDIQNHINGFLDEEPEHPYMWEGHDAYLIYRDDLNNEQRFLIDEDEKHCFEHEIEGDFIVNGEVFTDYNL
jgi:hypothetical protein